MEFFQFSTLSICPVIAHNLFARFLFSGPSKVGTAELGAANDKIVELAKSNNPEEINTNCVNSVSTLAPKAGSTAKVQTAAEQDAELKLKDTCKQAALQIPPAKVQQEQSSL